MELLILVFGGLFLFFREIYLFIMSVRDSNELGEKLKRQNQQELKDRNERS